MAWHHRGKGKCRRSCFDTFSRPVRHTLVQSIVDLLAELYHQVTTISWLTIRNMYTVIFRMALNRKCYKIFGPVIYYVYHQKLGLKA